MKSSRSCSIFVAACLAGLLVATARADEAASTIKFSDPSKPGTVKISVGHGELVVQGADTNEVSVKSDAKAVTSKPRKDGLRVISAASSFALSEKDNVVTIESALEFGRGNGNFKLTVPRNTSVIVNSAWGGGDITCRSLSGDIEIKCMNGEIKLEDISGSVVAGTMHGEIRASFSELREGKPLSFTTMNGEVQIRLPDSAKANVRLRTQNGSVMTDFDENVLVTKTEMSAPMPRGKNAWTINSGKGKVLTVEVEEAIREATRVSATAVQEALQAVKEGLDSSRIETDEARQKLDEANRELEKARKESERERRNAERTARNAKPIPAPAAPEPPAPAVPGKPPSPPKMAVIPTITGGKLVTGTLNGGGPEISVSTMNGDVILRRLEKK